MEQYRPAGRVSGSEYVEINRRLCGEEFDQAVEIARQAGLQRLDGRSLGRLQAIF